MSIRPIESEFGANGLRYRQAKRSGMVALYDVSNTAGKLYGHEVVRITVTPEHSFHGKLITAAGSYPGNEAFGKRGWYYAATDGDAAQAKLKALQEAASLPIPDKT